MRFLIDAQLPPALARWLEGEGHQAEHVSDIGLASPVGPATAQVYRELLPSPKGGTRVISGRFKVLQLPWSGDAPHGVYLASAGSPGPAWAAALGLAPMAGTHSAVRKGFGRLRVDG